MIKDNIIAAGNYIFNNGFLYQFSEGANYIGDLACAAKTAFVELEFKLTKGQFTEAFQYAESLSRKEDEVEIMFNKSHPELNP